MSYLLDRKKKNRKIRNVFFVVLILVILFYFRASIFKGFSYFTSSTLKPVLVVSNNIGAKFDNLNIYFNSKKALVTENENLKNEKNELSARITNFEILQKENDLLKESLDRSKGKNDVVLSTILVKPFLSLFDNLILDIGEDKGLETGDLVLAYGNIPIGRIAEVYSKSSKVILFSSNQEKTTGIIAGKNIYMDLIGRGGGNFEMILPRDLVLEKGTEIFLPDINSYVLAKVVTIISDPRDSYQKAILVSPVNIQELKFVEVVK